MIAAALLRETERACRRLGLERGDRILAGVSGGADSLALALLLARLAPRHAWTLAAICVNHGLRPEAEDEARHAAAACAEAGVPCRIVRVDARSGEGGLEERARRMRHAALEEERRRTDSRWIALAHHAGDADEDMLLRLLRGTGWPGLGGMPEIDPGRRIIRPLLDIAPERLRGFLRENAIRWCEDPSNADTAHARSRMRHAILPILRRENPSLAESLLRLRRLARLDADFWDAHLDDALKAHPWRETPDGLILPRDLLSPLHPAARLRLLHRAVRRIALERGGQARHDALLALERALSEGRGGLTFQMPGGISAILRRGAVILSAGRPDGRNAAADRPPEA